MRFAYCTGIRRCACSTKTTRPTMTRPTAMTVPNSIQPSARSPCSLMAHRALGKVAAIEMNIRIDMPLPMPRSVMSSPSHITVAVPAVIVMTIVIVTKIDWSGTISLATGQPWKRVPVRAVATRPVPWRIASAMVR
ncbi:hypothetical protein SALBM135S_01196 [Streptomyces alboniger]